jgi:hypothetical protein
MRNPWTSILPRVKSPLRCKAAMDWLRSRLLQLSVGRQLDRIVVSALASAQRRITRIRLAGTLTLPLGLTLTILAAWGNVLLLSGGRHTGERAFNGSTGLSNRRSRRKAWVQRHGGRGGRCCRRRLRLSRLFFLCVVIAIEVARDELLCVGIGRSASIRRLHARFANHLYGVFLLLQSRGVGGQHGSVRVRVGPFRHIVIRCSCAKACASSLVRGLTTIAILAIRRVHFDLFIVSNVV